MATRTKEQPAAKSKGWEARYERFQCDVPGYEDFWIEARVNFPVRVRKELLGADDETLVECIKANQLMAAWNLTDEHGKPLPVPGKDDGGVDALAELNYDLQVWWFRTVSTADVMAMRRAAGS